MEILIVSQNFYPENFKSNDIAFEIFKKGHSVNVLTGIPNYPQGKFSEGYGLFKKRVECINGVTVYRSFQIPRGKKYTKYLLPLTYFSFMFCGSIWAIYLALFKKFDIVIVHQVSPITQTLPAIIVKRIQKIPMVLWVLDLWPDAFTSGSGINNKIVIDAIQKYVDFSYRNSDKILIGSKSFFESVDSCNLNSNRIEYFPNWAEDIFEINKITSTPQLPPGFKIMLAGNLGVSQNLENILKAANKLKNEAVVWIILGDGSKKKWIEEFIKKNSLEKSVILIGKKPIDSMPSFYKQADIMLLSLNNKFNDLKKVVPARLQSYMAVGKPVLGFIDGAASEIINQANCGYTIMPNDILGLVNLIKSIIEKERKILPILGNNGKIYYEKHFQKKKCLNRLHEILIELKNKN